MVPVAKGQRRRRFPEIEFGALQHQIRFRSFGVPVAKGQRRRGIPEIEFGAPPAPNSISDCFGVPVATGQRRWWSRPGGKRL